MEQQSNQTWNLDTLYPGGSQSEILKKRMGILTDEIKTLANKLIVFNERKINNET